MKTLREFCFDSLNDHAENGLVPCGQYKDFSQEEIDQVLSSLDKKKIMSLSSLTPFYGCPVNKLENLRRLSHRDHIDILLSSNLISSLSNLQKLDISGTNVSDYGLCNLSTADLKRLNHLDISSCPNITMNGLKCLNEIKSLNIFYMNDFNFKLFEWPLKHSFQEVSLVASNKNFCPFMMNKLIKKSSTTLIKLDLSGYRSTFFNHQFRHRKLHLNLAGLSGLHTLKLANVHDMSTDASRSIGSILSLRSLDIVAPKEDDLSPLLYSLVTNQVPLEQLTLHEACLRESTFELLLQLQSLQSLNLHKCMIFLFFYGSEVTFLPDDAHHYLFAYLKNLHSLTLNDTLIYPSSTILSYSTLLLLPLTLKRLHLNLYYRSHDWVKFEPYILDTMNNLIELEELSVHSNQYDKDFIFHEWDKLRLPKLSKLEICIQSNEVKIDPILQLLHHTAATLTELSLGFGNVTALLDRIQSNEWPIFPKLQVIYIHSSLQPKYATDIIKFSTQCGVRGGITLSTKTYHKDFFPHEYTQTIHENEGSNYHTYDVSEQNKENAGINNASRSAIMSSDSGTKCYDNSTTTDENSYSSCCSSSNSSIIPSNHSDTKSMCPFSITSDASSVHTTTTTNNNNNNNNNTSKKTKSKKVEGVSISYILRCRKKSISQFVPTYIIPYSTTIPIISNSSSEVFDDDIPYDNEDEYFDDYDDYVDEYEYNIDFTEYGLTNEKDDIEVSHDYPIGKSIELIVYKDGSKKQRMY